MSVLRKIAGSLSQFSSSLASGHVSSGHCKRCGRETRWLVDLVRGHFRCLECDESGRRSE